MFKLTIKKSHILAIRRFAPAKDTRYCLNGIYFEVGQTESRIVACDGHRLAVIRGASPDIDADSINAVQSAIIPIAAFKSIKKPGRNSLGCITVAVAVDGGYTIADGDIVTSGKTIDGKYPDWRRVIPRSTSGISSQINGHYLADFADAAIDLGDKHGKVSIAHNGIAGGSDNGALVTIPGYPEFVGTVMPVRIETIVTTAPGWALYDLLPIVELAAAA